ncbi:biofilm regulation protein phosphatase SiaA [Chitinilyticum piscinae]|uniref:HAMP domain-containing protein n=1 Tax=Chitinilyticum piscinae TaxID=2866724 RepID=A0A8J7FM43_9NEIS|nr:biofilm regulation protein phosphatase SiaA [Chitinilyticum piscinae]MBE9610622.1 HAMP domain-containing protein [Chitinilyticum piscinae]
MAESDRRGSAGLDLGLRAKSMLLFALCAALIVALAWLIGMQVVESIRRHYGEAFAREHTLLYKQRLLAPLNRELALAQRLASEELVAAFFREEKSPGRRSAAIGEAEAYRKLMAGQLYALVVAASGNYYLNDGKLPFSEQPRYTVHPDNQNDRWFFSLIQRPDPVQLNVSQDEHLKTTKVWLNVMVGEAGQRLGLISAGLDLTGFLRDYVQNTQAGVSAMVIDGQGALMAHADPARIQYQVAGSTRIDHTLARYLGSEQDRQALQTAMARSRSASGDVVTLEAVLDGRRQLLALSYLPELQWYAVTALDWDRAQLISMDRILPWLIAALGMLALLFSLLVFGVDRGLLRPLARLTAVASAFGRGEYQVRIASRRKDELGQLARVFDTMAERVDRHAAELEDEVAKRTQELSEANQHMAVAHQHIQESLRYARLIQRSLLPEDEFRLRLGNQALLWLQPRDVVGGDLFIFRADQSGYLLGVIDCAGHGVPGAFMTMLAHVAADLALDQAGLADPARLISLIDTRVRSMLPAEGAGHLLATNMDAAFCYVNEREQLLCFAGAKLPLFVHTENGIERLPGGRRAIAERRQGEWHNEIRPLAGVSALYLATDGLFDQAGGEEGFGLGERRFADWLVVLSGLQDAAGREQQLEQAMQAWRGRHELRDDMAVVGVVLSQPDTVQQE